MKRRGLARCIGLSGKTVAGAKAALGWADAIMVEYHAEDDTHAGVIHAAHKRGVGVLVKKGLASGRLPVEKAMRFVLGNDARRLIGSRRAECRTLSRKLQDRRLPAARGDTLKHIAVSETNAADLQWMSTVFGPYF